jgi:hypothetical protein
MTKKKNAILTSQIEHYEKLLQEVSKEVDEQEQQPPERLDSVDNESMQNNTTNNKFKSVNVKEDYSDPKR